MSAHVPETRVDERGFIIIDATENRGRPLAPSEAASALGRAMTGAERKAKHDKIEAEEKLDKIGILDFETDPFEDDDDARIEPFVCCLYAAHIEPIIIWDEDFPSFAAKVVDAIERNFDGYTIYAHNGGKFDFLFLLHKIRGMVQFKGRGIMSAKIGTNELRDSFHIIPEKLASFHKEEFDYKKMRKAVRGKYRDEIIRYLVSDCVYLYELVHGFVGRFGFKISVGQAAMSELRKDHKVDRIAKPTDRTLREFFFGGRVECLRGAGHWKARPGKSFKLIDRNSMYPAEMAMRKHPVGSNYTKLVGNVITPNTAFIELSCYSHGALVRKNENFETSAAFEYGTFKTTIHEYNMAMKLGLLERVSIHYVIECDKWETFATFIHRIYKEKEFWKAKLDAYKAAGDDSSTEFWYAKRQYLFTKYILNNSYGKFAQNPERYKENAVTGPFDAAPEGFEAMPLPVFQNDLYAIWERPAPRSLYNNVGTAASITGAARADLLHTIHNTTNAIYCDTDSVICEEYNTVVLDIHPSRLGAWDLEAEFSEVIICGKKLYACKPLDFKAGQEKKIKIRSKGASGLDWNDMLDLLAGKVVETRNPAPTMTRTGNQFYMRRNIKRTAPILSPQQLERLSA